MQIFYALNVLLAVLLIINVLKIQLAGFRYITTQGGIELCDATKHVIIKSSVRVLGIMGLTIVNHWMQLVLTGSKIALSEWKLAHAEELVNINVTIFIGVFVVYAINVFRRHMNDGTKRNENDVVFSLDSETEEVNNPEKELEKVLAIIKERY